MILKFIQLSEYINITTMDLDLDPNLDATALNFQISEVFSISNKEYKLNKKLKGTNKAKVAIKRTPKGTRNKCKNLLVEVPECIEIIDDMYDNNLEIENVKLSEEGTNDKDPIVQETGETEDLVLDSVENPEDNANDCVMLNNNYTKYAQKSGSSIQIQSVYIFENSTLNSTDFDDDCVVISDDEIEAPEKHVEINEIVQNENVEHPLNEDDLEHPLNEGGLGNSLINEETILKEFYFEDEDICIVDELKIQRPKKILVRRTSDCYKCPLFCSFFAHEMPQMIDHLIKHRKRGITASQHNDDDENDFSFECPFCPFMTFYHTSFVNHITHHSYVLNCSKCSFTTNSVSNLKRHVATRHSAFFYCQKCPFKSKRKYAVMKHEGICKKPEKIGTLKCHFEPCPFIALTEENLKTHEWIQHQVGSSKVQNYKCPENGCYFETFRSELFDEHVFSTHSTNEMKCKLCNHRTHNFSSFKEHILKHISAFY